MSYESEVSADSPLLWYKLNESSGNAAQSGSYGYGTGTYQNSPTLSQTRLPLADTGTSVKFNGTNQYVSFWPNVSGDLTTTDMTLEAWIKWDSGGYDGTTQAIWSTSEIGGASGWLFLAATGSDKLALQGNTSSGWKSLLSDAFGFIDGVTYHVAVTHDDSSGDVEFYVNGVNIGSGTWAWTTPTTDANQGGVGAYKQTSTWYAFFDGWIDHAAYYDTTLTEARVVAHYEAGGAVAGLDQSVKLLIQSNEADGSIVFEDRSYSAHTVGRVGAEHDTDQAKFGTSSIIYDGASNLSVVDSTDWSFGNGDFTLDMWVRLDPGASSAGHTFLSHWASQNGYKGWIWGVNTSTNLMFFTHSYNGTVNQTYTSSWTPNTSQWYHVAIERSTTTLQFYVDGTKLGTGKTIGTNSLFNTSTAIRAGAYALSGGTPTTFWDGWQDEIRITKGVSRYGLTNFTPETQQYIAYPVAAPEVELLAIMLGCNF